jgi:glycosyltransferase involved in cell wall biosynthesis
MVSKNKPVLFLFNLETDSDSEVLAAGLDWVRAFAKQCSRVYVFSTHVGAYELPNNVFVRELSGNGIFRKIRWFFNNLRAIYIYLKIRETKVVFHHMSQYTVIFPGIVFKFLCAKQGLWYAHAKSNLSLVIAENISKYNFTSAPGAFPVNSSNLNFLGQGIDTSKFRTAFVNNIENARSGIFSLGRINPVKNLEYLLLDLPDSCDLEIEFMGRLDDLKYVETLHTQAAKRKLKLAISNALEYKKIPEYLIKWKYYYCGTNIAVDKAVVEAASSGCIVISLNSNVLNLTGMAQIYKFYGRKIPQSLFDQILFFEELSENEIVIIQEKLSEVSSALNDVNSTTEKILESLMGK